MNLVILRTEHAPQLDPTVKWQVYVVSVGLGFIRGKCTISVDVTASQNFGFDKRKATTNSRLERT